MDFPIDEIRELYSPENLLITRHLKNRLLERNISVSEVEHVILSGKIIQTYEDDKPFPSCLLLGKTLSDKPLHVVISHNDGFIYAITAYNPDTDIWDSDYTRKKG